MPRVVVVCLMLLVLAFAASSPAFAADSTPDGQDDLPANVEQATVVDVVDGDTIKVEIDGEEETVRLIGIDTPETVDPNTPDECYGAEASDHATRLLQDRTVWLETDVSDTDRYDRLLRSVWFQGKSDGTYYLANEVLVRRGYAVVSTYPPDVAYVDRLTAAQDLAVAESIGLWPGCGGADTPVPEAPSAPEPTPPAPGGGCDPSYPTLCLPVGSAGHRLPAGGRRQLHRPPARSARV